MKKKCEALATELGVEIRVYKFSDWQGWEYDTELLDSNNWIYEDQTTGRSGGGDGQYQHISQAWQSLWEDLQSLIEMKKVKLEI